MERRRRAHHRSMEESTLGEEDLGHGPSRGRRPLESVARVGRARHDAQQRGRERRSARSVSIDSNRCLKNHKSFFHSRPTSCHFPSKTPLHRLKNPSLFSTARPPQSHTPPCLSTHTSLCAPTPPVANGNRQHTHCRRHITVLVNYRHSGELPPLPPLTPPSHLPSTTPQPSAICCKPDSDIDRFW